MILGGNKLKDRFYVNDELYKLRMEMGLSREKLAARCKISSKTIQRAENGEKVKIHSIEKMANGLEVDKHTLANMNEDENIIENNKIKLLECGEL